MAFNKYIELGRICLVSTGPDQGKTVAIIDFVDQNRAMVDGPCSGVSRKVMGYKSLQITKFKIEVTHLMKSSTVAKLWKEADVTAKWQATSWAKRLETKCKRTAMSDFDRYKLMKARQMRSRQERTLARKAEAVLQERKAAGAQ